MTKNGIKFTIEVDNSNASKRQLAENIPLALDAMGLKGVNLIIWQMRQGYGKPIRQTGDLQRDVQYAVEGNELILGNTLEYSLYVHEGHAGHSVKLKDGNWITLPGGYTKGRPYIRDALFSRNNMEKLITIGDEYLSRGFK